MFIRTYLRPLKSMAHAEILPGEKIEMKDQFEEVFVVMEDPLLEFTKEDLAFLKQYGISIATC